MWETTSRPPFHRAPNQVGSWSYCGWTTSCTTAPPTPPKKRWKDDSATNHEFLFGFQVVRADFVHQKRAPPGALALAIPWLGRGPQAPLRCSQATRRHPTTWARVRMDFHFGAFCLDVGTLTFCQPMTFNVFSITPLKVQLLAGKQKATEF